MGELQDLLQAAAGEESTRSRIGRWRQRVSELIDGVASFGSFAELVAVITTLARTADRIFVRAPGTIVVTPASPDVVDMAEIDSNGIAYESTTGIYTLSGDRYYHLLAHGTELGGAPTATLELSWVNAANNAPLVASGPARFVPTTFATNDRASNPVAEAFLVSGSGVTQVKLRATAFGGANASLDDDFVVTIVEIR